MAQQADHYKKYQVYFFLYLAVICELLIIIVERDEAEESLLFQQRQLEQKNRAIILELLKNMPAVAAAGDNQLKVNETRYFTIRVKGLGEKDEVTTPPIVHVYKEGEEIQTMRYPEDIRDSTQQSTTGEKLYRFNWVATFGPGRFEFWVEAGTNRIMLSPDLKSDAKVKVGSLEFTTEEIQNAINTDPILKGTPIASFIRRSESLDPAKFVVDVVSDNFEQFVIKPASRQVVTAVGYPVFNRLNVEGTSPDKVASINVIEGPGIVLSSGNGDNPFAVANKPAEGAWAWRNTFQKPGEINVRVNGSDRRGAGALSSAKPIEFRVIVKEPFLAREKPRGAFAGEVFNMSVNVAGLEDVGDYRWKLYIENKEVEAGVGNMVKFSVPTDALGKTLKILATYRNMPYQILPDSAAKDMTTSEFIFPISSPIDRVTSESFATGQEYPVNNVFQFVAARCGICTSANIQNIQRNEMRIEVETADGQDLLDQVDAQPRKNPTTGTDAGTLVKFYLKGKVSKDGTDATIRIRFGSVDKRYQVTLFPD